MPTVAVDKYALFEALGRKYTTEEFDHLCFEFGIELDEDTENDPDRPKDEAPQLKIEIPANRYDMLCHEGITLMLKIFLGQTTVPNYRVVAPANGEIQQITVHQSTEQIRPYVSCAILRGVKFTQARYDSFIALQDKLHQNLCRQRTLVSMGTHDLDTVKGPFTYEALPPQDIVFAPLNQTKVMNGKELMEFYDKDKNLGRYLHIIRDSPVYPVILDANRNVCSLPPIINSDRSKITLDTRNVFIEITATDRTKVEVVNHILVAMFSEYCDEPFTVEPVKIISAHNNESRETPNMTPRATTAEVSYINSCCGLQLSAEEICASLKKMSLIAKPSATDKNLIDVDIPITRADVLHQCDIMEDVAIAHGYDNLTKTFPSKSGTIAAPLPLNKLADIARNEAAMCGWTEVMPLILCSHDENFAWLNRKDDGKTAVRLANPKTVEYQVVRTSLLPGLLKTIRENRKHSLPIKVFEASDVAFKDDTLERKSRNERHFAVAYCAKTSGFEVVHGLLDRLMAMLSTGFNEAGALEQKEGYWIEGADDDTYFPGRGANIWVRYPDGKTEKIGSFGILHPSVLEKFEIPYPVSALELNLEAFI
ncbi:phenylalanyl-tRNA synthetase [Ascodesmis nigricans]|uniref:Phenylalanine--tRNA ligase beta subunit n=1 Tax=Ascodesmis nigricans TaxID=341454 RepID=A0A4S2N1H6_9PEZI|nr:phenylalanyl-tRNA synthetase [Ascodesmis nigricans]